MLRIAFFILLFVLVGFNSSFAQVKYDKLIDNAERQLKLGNFDRALEHYQKAHKLNPDDHEINYLLAMVYHRLNDYEKAISYANKAVELNPDFRNLVAAGSLNARQENYEKAIEQLLAANKITPENYTVNWYLADVYMKLDDNKNAITYLKKAREYSVKENNKDAIEWLDSQLKKLGE